MNNFDINNNYLASKEGNLSGHHKQNHIYKIYVSSGNIFPNYLKVPQLHLSQKGTAQKTNKVLTIWQGIYRVSHNTLAT